MRITYDYLPFISMCCHGSNATSAFISTFIILSFFPKEGWMREQFNIFSIARYVQINIYCGAAVCLSSNEIGVVDECVDILWCLQNQSIQLHRSFGIWNFRSFRESEYQRKIYLKKYRNAKYRSKRMLCPMCEALDVIFIFFIFKHKVYDECWLALTQPQQRHQQLNNHKPTSKRVTDKHNHIKLCVCGYIINRQNAVRNDADSIFSRVFARNK